MCNFTTKLKAWIGVALLALSASAMAREASISIEVSDISSTDAYITVTPSSPDLQYYWNITEKVRFEQSGGAEGIVQNRIDNWKRDGEIYECSWQEMMGYELTSGEEASTAYDKYDYLIPDTQYVVYAFGMDETGEVTAPVAVSEFTTAGAIRSDNTFTLSLLSLEATSAIRMTARARAVPSNDDTYIVRCINKSVVDKAGFVPGDGSDNEKAFIASEMTSFLYDNEIVSGTQEFEFERLRKGEEYCLIAMGVDVNKAPSTALTVYSFLADDQPEEPSHLTIEVSEITAADALISITPATDDLRYYWNITSKKDFESSGGKDRTVQNRIDVWKRDAEMYDTTWQDIMNDSMNTGATAEYASDYYGRLLYLSLIHI